MIVEDSKRGRGLGKAFVSMAVDYAFAELGVTKVICVFQRLDLSLHSNLLIRDIYAF